MRRPYDRSLPPQLAANGAAMSRGNSLYQTLSAARSVQPGNRHETQLRTTEQELPQVGGYGNKAYYDTYTGWFDPTNHKRAYPSGAYAFGMNVFISGMMGATLGTDINARLAMLDENSIVLALMEIHGTYTSGNPPSPAAHWYNWTLPAAPDGCQQCNDLHQAVIVPSFNALEIVKATCNVGDVADLLGGSSYVDHVYIMPYPCYEILRLPIPAAKRVLTSSGSPASTGIIWANAANHSEAFPVSVIGRKKDFYGVYDMHYAFRRRCGYDLLWSVSADAMTLASPYWPRSTADFRINLYAAGGTKIGFLPMPLAPYFPNQLSIGYDAGWDWVHNPFPQVCGAEYVLTGDAAHESLTARLSPVEEWLFIRQ
jgi:hypothetical protein